MEAFSVSYFYCYSKSGQINFGNSVLVVAALHEISQNIRKWFKIGS